SQATINNDVFDTNGIGVLIDVDQFGGNAANVTVTNSEFVGNEAGVFINGLDGAADPGAHVTKNDFQANLFGVFCWSEGENGVPLTDHNNFNHDYLEAVSGFNGDQANFPSSTCNFDRNFYGDDTQFIGATDTNTNIRNTAWADFTTPSSPVTVTVITTVQTMTLPATLNGPLVVGRGGNLTIKDGTLDANHQFWGSAPGGSLQTKNLVVKNNGLLLVRNDADSLKTITMSGRTHWDDEFLLGLGSIQVWQYRNHALLDGWSVDKADSVYLGTSGITTETTTYQPTIQNFLVTNSTGMGGILGTTFKPTFTNNNYRLNNLVWFILLATYTSTGETYESNNIAVESELSTVSYSGDLFASNNLGIVSAIDTGTTADSTGLAYNAYAAVSLASTLTITNSNFRDNYQQSMMLWAAFVAAALVEPTLTCSNCWFYQADDKSYDANGGGTITVTQSLAANNAPNPPWLNDVIIADGAATKTLSGTLKAPAISRGGGTLLVDGVTLDGDGSRFPIGAKTGGVGAAATGHITIKNSTVNNIRYVALNDSAGALVENNVFNKTATLFESFFTGATIRCNQISNTGIVDRWIRQQGTGKKLVYDSNLLSHASDVRLGLEPPETETADILRNGFTNGNVNPDRPLVWRNHDGTIQAHENNILTYLGMTDSTNTAAGDAGGLVFNATNNYWNSPNGPTVGSTVGGAIFEIDHNGQPTYTPFYTSLHPVSPCAGFSISPTSPTELDTVTLKDTAFAPDTSGVASKVWDFGDGSPTQTITDGTTTVTHKFVDGGSYTVKLTVTANSGASAVGQKVVAVSHVAPVGNFVSSVVNEITAVTFTDTSTHPNTPRDDPPTGWTYAWNFNNGEGSSSARNPSFRFADGGSKSVKLTVTDNDGQTNQVTRTITVPHVSPVANFGWTGSAESDTFQFADSSTHPNAPNDHITAWAWTCNDGFTSASQNPSHKFPDGGTFSCSLKVTDDDGQQNTVTKSVAVGHVAPVANFGSTLADESSPVSFTDSSSHPNPNDAPPSGWAYAWDFNNGEGTSSARNPGFQFGNGGDLPVTLTVTDNDGMSSSVTRTISVPNPGDTVVFSDASTHPNAPRDSIVSWSWDFDDGSALDTSQSPAHVFVNQGAYQVTLTVTDGDGETSSLTIRVPIGNIPPAVQFTFSPQDPTDLDTVSFDSSGTTDPDGSIVSYAWAFSDGFTSTAQNVDHRFLDDGDYDVTLTVTDNLGGLTALTQTVSVANVGPTAGLTANPANPQVNDPVQFYDGSNDPDGNIVSWDWTFGDGAGSADANPVHTFAAGGDYTVTLTVVDDDGVPASIVQNVHVCETHISLVLADPQIEVCTKIHLDDPVSLVGELEELVTDLVASLLENLPPL
ncbi:MAG: PKD domain-containing protein, partial [Halobacteriales archaeon]|nr:PKD domain-containing protein [Halobacteriales archaeon]